MSSRHTNHETLQTDFHTAIQGRRNEYTAVILNGHVDVAPEGDHSQSHQSPYADEIVDGCLFGRGATDMQGGNLAAYIAVATLKGLGIQLQGDVILQSAVEEEAWGTGTSAALVCGYRADAALILEPTEQKIFPRQPGSRWFRLRIEAHGGARYEGVNALEKSVAVIQAIQALEKERNTALNDELYKDVPIPLPINLGRIEGCDWPSSVPDEIMIAGRIGVGPGESPWGTDGGLMMQYGIPALVFAPGITRLAHSQNEHIRLDDTFNVTGIMALTLVEGCGQAS